MRTDLKRHSKESYCNVLCAGLRLLPIRLHSEGVAMRESRIVPMLLCLSQSIRRQTVVLVFMLVVAFTGQTAAQQCSNVDFVKRIYGDLLFRPADANGLTFFVPLVSSTSRQAVAQAIAG